MPLPREEKLACGIMASYVQGTKQLLQRLLVMWNVWSAERKADWGQGTEG